MEYGKLTFDTLLWASIALPIPANSGEATAASASARIILHLPSRVEWDQNDVSSSGQLCLGDIPAHSYHLSIRNIGEGTASEKRLPGQSGNYCIPLAVSQQGKILMVARIRFLSQSRSSMP